MSLRDTVAKARSSRKKEGTGTTLTPAEYNRRKNLFIHNMVTHENPIVRAAALSNDMCPTNQVNEALKSETNRDVLREILMSDKVSSKAIETFCDSPAADQFDGDTELETRISFRLSGDEDSSSVAPDNGDDSEDIFEEGSEDEN